MRWSTNPLLQLLNWWIKTLWSLIASMEPISLDGKTNWSSCRWPWRSTTFSIWICHQFRTNQRTFLWTQSGMQKAGGGQFHMPRAHPQRSNRSTLRSLHRHMCTIGEGDLRRARVQVQRMPRRKVQKSSSFPCIFI